MPALATLTLVWLGAQQPEGRAKVALDAWAESQGAKLEEPRSPPPEDVERHLILSTQCDQALDRARDQSNSGDGEAARQTLRQLEQTLRDHPDLSQAAWLMAERYRLEAQIAVHDASNPTREPAPDDAVAWDRRADILEGERAVAFGARPRSSKTPNDRVTVTLAVHGARRYEVFWDGASATDRIATPAGEHHVVIRRGGRAAWSGWVSVLAAGTIDVWVPDAVSCSSEDLAGVSFGAADMVVANGVRCEAWAVAAPGPTRGTLKVALCSGERCQPPTTSAYETFASASPEGATEKKRFLPGWAAWTIAGAGVAAATTLVLWGSGAFDRADPGKKVVWDPNH